jgi:hypothetical protein
MTRLLAVQLASRDAIPGNDSRFVFSLKKALRLSESQTYVVPGTLSHEARRLGREADH